ncbi:rhodanese-like domain-containing protein [Desulforhopalus sp. 52FAK]
MEPQKKVLVSEQFLDSVHGEVSCVDCHGGDDEAVAKEDAHKGYDPYPSINSPQETCGECHDEIAETAPKSLHATLSTFPKYLEKRSSAETFDKVDHGRQRHCASCHATCGSCHVSRPQYVGDGFINGHMFRAQPDTINQCMACHGSRIGNEFAGNRGQGDVHVRKYTMVCKDCHKAEEMHAAAPDDIVNRYHLEEAASCRGCHKDLEYGSVLDHKIHKNRVQCQVCHSQSYTNCYSCHTGTDDKGIPYFVTNEDFETIKIGLNPDKTPRSNYKYTLLRHVPVDEKLFDYYITDGFPNFDSLSTWKKTSPHNIQRRTWQNANCNNCHGQRELFLSEDELLDYEKKANIHLVVSDADLPKARGKTQPLGIDATKVNHSMVVDVTWLKENLADNNVVILDVRGQAAYDSGHIPGAIRFDPAMPEGLRKPGNSDSPMMLEDDDILAATLGELGLTVDSHIVAYSNVGQDAGFILAILDYAGANNLSLLNGGIAAWKKAGLEVSMDAVQPEKKTFVIEPRNELVVHNDYVKANLDNPGVTIVDVRILQQSLGALKHPLAKRPGRIPGSILFPITGLYMDHSYLKGPEELLWVLKERNIRPNKTIVVSCNTGWWGAGAQYMLRYLGYEDVRLHDESWIGWLD